MDFSVDLQQLEGVIEALSENWSRQNNSQDNLTRFIYRISSYTELMQCEEMGRLTDEDKQYALHRWYNSKTSKVCERIFVEYGAIAANQNDDFHHIDVYINGVPFDIKVSVFPQNWTVQNMHLDLKRRADRNRLIKWFYSNQSSEQRNCFNNRIFIVCNGNNVIENSRLKQSFDQMDVKINAYMEYLRQTDYAVNEVSVRSSDGQERVVKAEIITVNQESENLKERLLYDICPNCNSRYRLMIARLEAYRGNTIMKCPNCNGYINV